MSKRRQDVAVPHLRAASADTFERDRLSRPHQRRLRAAAVGEGAPRLLQLLPAVHTGHRSNLVAVWLWAQATLRSSLSSPIAYHSYSDGALLKSVAVCKAVSLLTVRDWCPL